MELKTLADRLNYLIKTKNISQEKLAKKSGVSQPAIQKIASGITKSPRNILAIANALEVNAQWLLYGDFHLMTPSETKYHKIEKDSITKDRILNLSSIPDGELETEEVEVPFYNSIEIAANHGSNVSQKAIDYHKFTKSFLKKKDIIIDNIVCFPALGNSMDPIIPDGSIVAADIANKIINDGSLYAINHGGLYRLKLLYALPNQRVKIRSYNTVDYPDEEANLKDIEIIGKVFWYAVDVK